MRKQEFQLRVGRAPRFRYRPGGYGIFAPFAAIFWMCVLVVTVVWFAVKLTVTILIATAQWMSEHSSQSSRK